MASVYRMIFDISVYYAVTGIYLQVFCHKLPFVPGLVLLCLSMLLYGMCTVKAWMKKGRFCIFLIPLIGILFRPSIVDVIHFLPAWIYGSVVLIQDRAQMDYDAFRKRFVKSFALMAGALIPALLMVQPVLKLIGNVLGYLSMVIVCGVLCLRTLQDREGGLQQLLIISLFTLACVALCYFGIPQKLLELFRDYVLLGILSALGRLASLFTPGNQGVQEQSKEQLETGLRQNNQTQGRPFEIVGEYSVNETVITWIETVFYLIAAAVIAVILVKLTIGLVKSLKQGEKPEKQYAWKDEVVRLREADSGNGNKRRRKPRDSRMVVRYYYWRYMQECAKRGIRVKKGWTVEDLGKASLDNFPQADIAAMQELYCPVRYDDQTEVTSKQAREAARLWQNLKKNKQEQ